MERWKGGACGSPRALLGTALLLLGQISLGAQDWKAPFQVTGFGTLGIVRSSTDEARFRRDLSQPSGAGRDPEARVDSRLGMQLDLGLGDSLRATLQAVSRYRYDGTFTPDLTWAFLAWQPVPDLELRAGRLGFDVFMNADCRDVGYAMLWARPPVEYFGTIPVSSLDGMDLTRTFGRETRLRLKVYAGVAQGQLPVRDAPRFQLGGSPMGGLVGELQGERWRARLAYAHLRFRHELPDPFTVLTQGLRQFGQMLQDPRPGEAAEALRLKDRVATFASAGLAYEGDALQALGMVARYHSDAVMSPESWSGFLSAGWRKGSVVTYGLWSRVVGERPRLDLGLLPNLPLPEAQALVAGVQAGLVSNQNDQTTAALGVRWDLAPRAALKIQVDRIRTHHAAGLWDRGPAHWSGRATVASVSLDFIF